MRAGKFIMDMEGGVSRSGRIRKKSSKLRDYQSPEDWDVGLQSNSTKRIRQNSEQQQQQQIVDNDEGHLGDVSQEDEGEIAAQPSRSIYMSEKNNSKTTRVVMKDGTVLLKRQQRKDKGKTRMTAYMLWARSIRQQMKDGPELDFAARSRRLGELWANVPNSERLLWKRRVKQYNKTKAKQDLAAMKAEAQAQAVAVQTSNNSKFLNKSRTTANSSKGGGGTNSVQRKNARSGGSRNGKVVRPTECTDPVNIAAHFKLLGDSLSNIGESLGQHEGRHNSITGVVSVLLDSLLCSVVPLICLTTQVEGFGDRVVHLKETLANTLDNIAYVMPGLP